MKKIRVFILALATVSQFVHPLLAITLNRESARLDALQMNLAINDYTDVIGLDHFGGNPAGIILDEKRSRVLPLVRVSRSKVPPLSFESDSQTLGILGLFRSDQQALRLELEGVRGESDQIGSNTDSDSATSELAYNRRFGQFLAGFDLNYTNTDSKGTSGSTPFDSNTKSDPLSYIVGFGWTQAVSDRWLDLGISASRDRVEANNNFESDSSEFSVQAIYRKQDTFALGFTTTLEDSETTNSDSESEAQIYSLRTFWDIPENPFQIGADYTGTLRDSDQLSSGVSISQTETVAHVVGLGLAYKINDRNLIGIEDEFTVADSDFDSLGLNIDSKSVSNSVALGLESKIFERMVGRASFSYNDSSQDRSGSVTTKFNSVLRKVALGAGYSLSEDSQLDFVYFYSDTSGGSSDAFANSGTLTYTLFFGARNAQ